jgi:hypothetical protein
MMNRRGALALSDIEPDPPAVSALRRMGQDRTTLLCHPTTDPGAKRPACRKGVPRQRFGGQNGRDGQNEGTHWRTSPSQRPPPQLREFGENQAIGKRAPLFRLKSRPAQDNL